MSSHDLTNYKAAVIIIQCINEDVYYFLETDSPVLVSETEKHAHVIDAS